MPMSGRRVGKRKLFGDEEKLLEELETRFGIKPPRWALGLDKIQWEAVNTAMGISSRGYAAGRVNMTVYADWIVSSGLSLDVQELGCELTIEDPEVMENAFAIARAEYVDGRMVGLSIRPSDVEPPHRSRETESPEESVARLGASLEEISREQE